MIKQCGLLVNLSKKVVIVYAIWFFTIMLFALYGYFFANHGEFGVACHLWLIITGIPAALLSGYFPHGSLTGIFVAGLLGMIQWYFVSVVILFFLKK